MSMTTESGGRQLRIFCPTHKTTFTVVAAGTIMCESGGHALAQNFPVENFWEYCCDCQHYWRSDIVQSGKGREQCPVCERAFARRYVCDSCKLISSESDETVRRKAYAIAPAGGIEPACPGCLSQPRSKLRSHQCDEVATSFATARAVCPFCGEEISDPPCFPSLVADYLDRVRAKKVEVSFDPQTSLLVAARGGEFVLVPVGDAAAPSIVVPRAARFETRQDYYAYENFYYCVDAAAGEVRIVRPAVVDKADGGWRLRDIGELDIKRDAAVYAEPPSPPRTEGSESCPKCSTARVANKGFCGQCGHRFSPDGVAPVAPEPSPSYPPDDDATVVLPRGDDDSTAFTSTVPASSGRRVGMIVTAVAVVAVLALVAIFALNSGTSLEGKLEKAIADGNLLTPAGGSAYDYYQQLKNQGADSRVLARFDSRLLPLLTNAPQQMLAEFAKPGSTEPPASQWQEACKQLSWASQIKPDDTSLAARAAYCEGRVSYLNDNKDAALATWLRASELDRSWALATNGVGLIYNERKEYETARPFLREAIRRDPNWAVPYNNLGTSYYYRKNYEEAEAHYQEAVEHAPSWARPHAWLGDIAKYRRDYARAAREYEIVLDPSSIGTSKMDLNAVRQRLEEVRRLAGQGN
jgi:tetratricopeptide (TPR) repeat protein